MSEFFYWDVLHCHSNNKQSVIIEVVVVWKIIFLKMNLMRWKKICYSVALPELGSDTYYLSMTLFDIELLYLSLLYLVCLCFRMTLIAILTINKVLQMRYFIVSLSCEYLYHNIIIIIIIVEYLYIFSLINIWVFVDNC